MSTLLTTREILAAVPLVCSGQLSGIGVSA